MWNLLCFFLLCSDLIVLDVMTRDVYPKYGSNWKILMWRKIAEGSGKSDSDEVFICYYNRILEKVGVQDPVEDIRKLLLVVYGDGDGMVVMFFPFYRLLSTRVLFWRQIKYMANNDHATDKVYMSLNCITEELQIWEANGLRIFAVSLTKLSAVQLKWADFQVLFW